MSAIATPPAWIPRSTPDRPEEGPLNRKWHTRYPASYAFCAACVPRESAASGVARWRCFSPKFPPLSLTRTFESISATQTCTLFIVHVTVTMESGDRDAAAAASRAAFGPFIMEDTRVRSVAAIAAAIVGDEGQKEAEKWGWRYQSMNSAEGLQQG